ncbi:uncharacterized protein (TIGR02679 family) [Allocatelliglobosispora scoriae]|uniref:Uncharacterized protein (TIGR02679 family) n=1 Tax=Allocatelliglobosispora scoriae TaxID=643052 RepID=A0A841BNS2_9ACTN|nr:uncharacterized protein (TIGR02679 family) [Allocatelliglobosispora scoriae]
MSRLRQGNDLTGSITLTDPDPEQRRATELLLGRAPRRASSISVSLDDLDTMLRRSGIHPDGLRSAALALRGPVTAVADQRAAEELAWREATAPLTDLVDQKPHLLGWYADPRTQPLLRRLGAPDIFADLARTLQRLPTAPLPLAQFAALTTGNAHALDHGTPLSTLTLSAIRATWWPPGADLTTAPAEQRRELWDTVGVLVDELSTTVLTLDLPVTDGPLTYLAALPGEPAVLTLRQLVRQPSTFAPTAVYICENPTVLAAAADLLGSTCPAMVCTNGQPTTAVIRLLHDLHRDGCELFYHGDFDWGGLRIANRIRTRVPWQPWRFDTRAYTLACANFEGQPLADQPGEAHWDQDLANEIRAQRKRIEEELVLSDLLYDLTDAGPTRRV